MFLKNQINIENNFVVSEIKILFNPLKVEKNLV